MKHASVASFALCLGSLTLAAQTTTSAPAQNKAAGIARQAGIDSQVAGCPASFHARQSADGTVLKAATDHPKGVGQRILLTATPDSREIVSATVTVHSWTPTWRLAQTNQVNLATPAPSTAAQTLTARFSNARRKLRGSSLGCRIHSRNGDRRERREL
jgi:hypothetical protein